MKSLLLALLIIISNASALPSNANKYKKDLTRAVYNVYGIDGNVALFASHIHQESRWNPNARSKYAVGLAQITPRTASWFSKVKGLDEPAPLDYKWSMEFMVEYMKYLQDNVPYETDCDKVWNASRAYNGGLGWIKREARKAESANYKDLMEVCEKTGRSKNNCRENTYYPQRIYWELLPTYIEYGWPGVLICKKDS